MKKVVESVITFKKKKKNKKKKKEDKKWKVKCIPRVRGRQVIRPGKEDHSAGCHAHGRKGLEGGQADNDC